MRGAVIRTRQRPLVRPAPEATVHWTLEARPSEPRRSPCRRSPCLRSGSSVPSTLTRRCRRRSMPEAADGSTFAAAAELVGMGGANGPSQSGRLCGRLRKANVLLPCRSTPEESPSGSQSGEKLNDFGKEPDCRWIGGDRPRSGRGQPASSRWPAGVLPPPKRARRRLNIRQSAGVCLIRRFARRKSLVAETRTKPRNDTGAR